MHEEEDKDADFEQIKKDIHQRAKKIVSSFPRQFAILNKICENVEFLHVKASQSIALRTQKDPSETSDVCDCVGCKGGFSSCFTMTTSLTEPPTTSSSAKKRKRENAEEADVVTLKHRMKHNLADQRDLLLSDIDDLTLSLNLRQLEPRPSTILNNRRLAEAIDARQSVPSLLGC